MSMDYNIVWKIRRTKPKNEIEKRIYDNIFLVTKIMSRRKSAIDVENVFMDGVEALIEAAHKYDSSKNIKFTTYAYTAIRRKVACSIIEDGKCVALPRYAKEAISQIIQILATNPNLTLDEINLKDYNIRGVKKEETLQSIKNIYSGLFNLISLYESNEDDDERDVPEAQYSTNEFSLIEDKLFLDSLKQIISRLPARQKEVIMKRFFNPEKDYVLNYAEVAREMGIHRQVAYRLEQKAIDKIQKKYKEIKEYEAERS